jgi:hypothetical protein
MNSQEGIHNRNYYHTSGLNKSMMDLPNSDDECSIAWINADYKPLPRKSGFFLCIYADMYIIVSFDKEKDKFIRTTLDPWMQEVEEEKISHWIKIEKPNRG